MDIPPGWQLSEDQQALEKSFEFADFAAAFAFLTQVALHSQRVNHHPEFTSCWNRVDFRLTSHDCGQVTERDLALAKAIDRIAGQGRRGAAG